MDKKFITAKEAKEKANAYSNMEQISEEIERAANNGRFKMYLSDITSGDKAELEMLGYTVTKNEDWKYPITVSWE